jgi:hypothetical protein
MRVSTLSHISGTSGVTPTEGSSSSFTGSTLPSGTIMGETTGVSSSSQEISTPSYSGASTTGEEGSTLGYSGASTAVQQSSTAGSSGSSTSGEQSITPGSPGTSTTGVEEGTPGSSSVSTTGQQSSTLGSSTIGGESTPGSSGDFTTGQQTGAPGLSGVSTTVQQGSTAGSSDSSTLVGTSSVSGQSTVSAGTNTGSTTKRCEEMQAIDKIVSEHIIVTPTEISKEEKVQFQPTSSEGVSFPKDEKTPTLTVTFGKPVEVQSVTIPRNKTPNANVEQFEVIFYSPDGNEINTVPVRSSTSPEDDETKPAHLDSSKIPSNVLVSHLNISIIKTTDDESPKGVILDVIACIERTKFTAMSTLATGGTGTEITVPVTNTRAPGLTVSGGTSVYEGTTGTQGSTVSGETPAYQGSTITQGSTGGLAISSGKWNCYFQKYLNKLEFLEGTTTPTATLRCQTENLLAEELGLVEAELISETTKAETKIVGYVIRINSTGWTPSSAFSSLNIDFRHPVEVY